MITVLDRPQPPARTPLPPKPSAAGTEGWAAWNDRVETIRQFLQATQDRVQGTGRLMPPVDRADVAAAMPGPGAICATVHLKLAIGRLGFEAEPVSGGRTDEPRLHSAADGAVSLLPVGAATPRAGTTYAARPQQRRAGSADGRAGSWFSQRMAVYFPGILLSLVLTIAANVLALAMPLFAMAAYDKVIGSGSVATLVSLSIGAAAALVLEVLMRSLRNRVMADQGARLSYSIGNAVFGRLLSLPLAATEHANVSTQLARVRDLERVRDLLTGPIAQSCLDLPFVVVFLVGIALIGGWLVLSPLVAILTFCLGALFMVSRMRARIAAAAQAAGQRQALVLELVEKMQAIRATGSAPAWRDRFAQANTAAVAAGGRHGLASALVAQLSQALVLLGGLTTLLFGIRMVMVDSMTSGALIGAMIMTWRLLQPMQTMFVAATRIGQMAASIKQIDALMQLQPERGSFGPAGPRPTLSGALSFSRIIFRYGREAEPTLSGLSFDVAAGEIVAVVGRNGSGKSTLLKLVAGLYVPQVGSIRIDGQDVGQFDPVALRRAIAFVPQVPQLIPGTLADNLRLGEPLATDADLWEALEAVDARVAVEGLPHRLATPIDIHGASLPIGLLTRLSLARAWIRKAGLMLIDEPAGGLDPETEFAFTSAIAMLRGRSTALFVTHRRSHLGIADKVLILEHGAIRHYGPAAQAREHIFRGMI